MTAFQYWVGTLFINSSKKMNIEFDCGWIEKNKYCNTFYLMLSRSYFEEYYKQFFLKYK